MASQEIATGWGFGGRYRQSIDGALKDRVIITNGFNQNLFYYLKNGKTYEIGLEPPAVPAVATGTPAGAGINGTFRYRLRRLDIVTGTMSLPGPEASVVATADKVVVTFPADNTQRPGCNWIVERTTNKGKVFFPVNLNDASGTATPNGTTFGTATYDDERADDNSFTFIKRLPEVQAKPRAFKLCKLHDHRMFYAGGVKHSENLTLTHGDATVTSAEDFFAPRMSADGWQFSAFDADGAVYTVLTFTNSKSIELDRPYTGLSEARTCLLTSLACNRFAWSEPFEPEYCGAAVITGAGNEEALGDNAEITCMEPLGKFESVSHIIFAKLDRLYDLVYTAEPGFNGGGRIYELNARRGALGARCMLAIDGRIYGMDHMGIWSMTNAGVPEEIGGAIRQDWKAARLNFAQPDGFWIQHRPQIKELWFWIVEGSNSTPKRAFRWSLERQAFVGTGKYWRGMTSGCEIVDSSGRRRAVGYLETA